MQDMPFQTGKNADIEYMAHDYDPREATIESIQHDLFSGKTTCRKVVASFIARILAFNDELRAVIALNHRVFEIADALDIALATGQAKGCLFGIPVLLKDNFDEVNMKTTGGCKALADLQPGKDAATVKSLKDAGAIIIGKANLHEMALEGLTVSSLGGQSVNPYDLTRTPGGSSGGSGVAVAASLCVFATGTDTMNSLRSPASANNLFSIRPTWGLVSGAGVMPISFTQDAVGPIARCTKDLAIALTVMASGEADKGVSAEVSAPPINTQTDYYKDITSGKLQDLRLGLLETFVDSTGASETSPVNEAMNEILAHLRRLGSNIMPVNEGIYDVNDIFAKTDTQQYEFQEELNGYLSQSTHSGNFPASFKELYQSKDILVIPTRRNLITKALTSSTDDVEYQKIKNNIKDLKYKLEETFDRLNLDAIIYPEQSNLVVRIGSPSQHGRNGILAAVTGWPVVTVPMGFSPPTKEAPLGVPIGMEILGRPGTEQDLLQIAYQIETRIAVRRSPLFTDHCVESKHITNVPPLPLYAGNIHQTYPSGSWLT